MLILCDGGGSNSARARLWKHELCHEICEKYGISIRVYHYPTVASKWNPVEHRLFGPITANWQGAMAAEVDRGEKSIPTET